MNSGDMILISVDDQDVEPPNMWDSRVPKKYAEYAPKIVLPEDGTEAWEYQGTRSQNIGLNAVAGRPRRTMASTQSSRRQEHFVEPS